VTASQNSHSHEIATLTDEMDRIKQALDHEYEAAVRGRWTLQLGRLAVSGEFRSQRIARFYIAICLATFAAGAALTIFTKATELGSAMIVGAIFAGATFVAQWWTVQVQHEGQTRREIAGATGRERWIELGRRKAEIAQRLDELDA
jgi:hypothetical protein